MAAYWILKGKTDSPQEVGWCILNWKQINDMQWNKLTLHIDNHCAKNLWQSRLMCAALGWACNDKHDELWYCIVLEMVHLQVFKRSLTLFIGILIEQILRDQKNEDIYTNRSECACIRLQSRWYIAFVECSVIDFLWCYIYTGATRILPKAYIYIASEMMHK